MAMCQDQVMDVLVSKGSLTSYETSRKNIDHAMLYSSGQKSSRFFSVQRKENANGTETQRKSLTFRSCNSLEPQMLYLVFNSTFPSLPPGAKTLRTSNSYLVLLFSYSRREVHAQFFVSVCHSYRNITT